MVFLSAAEQILYIYIYINKAVWGQMLFWDLLHMLKKLSLFCLCTTTNLIFVLTFFAHK